MSDVASVPITCSSGNEDECYMFQSRFCSNLALSNPVQKAATHIARKAVELDLVAGSVFSFIFSSFLNPGKPLDFENVI